MRIPLAGAAVLVATSVAGVAPALGQDAAPLSHSPSEALVTANINNTFTPQTVTVRKHGTVTWQNMGGVHDVVFDDGSFRQPPEASPLPWTVSRTFPRKGTFGYFCSVHGGPGGVGMAGVVIVSTH